MKKIAVIGCGYVGLSNALLLSSSNEVGVFDISSFRREEIKNKISPFKEAEIVSYLESSKLKIYSSLEEAIKDSSLIIVATPTNYDNAKGNFDTTSVEEIVNKVKEINPSCWVIIKSTVGVGFTQELISKSNLKNILFVPEFLREGKAIEDNLYPSRIIIGVPSKEEIYLKKAKEVLDLFASISKKEDVTKLIVGSSEAEAIKLFSNTYLALRVAYFNEIDTFAVNKNLNTSDIISGVCADPRIGNYYNNPSFGYGGYCLPKDTKELRASFLGVPEDLISASVKSNETRMEFIAEDIFKLYKEGDIFGIYRLTMKNEGDNFRESSIQVVMKKLLEKKVKLVIYEPQVKEDSFLGIKVIKDIEEFKKMSSLIICNRYEPSLDDVKEKIYTRDLFKRD
ncbi:MAG: nucleotide sugar dehydrogenase [Bacilli bacterium]|nr:nucleotide sugar dehydrogenase [Bacilli bacterium]